MTIEKKLKQLLLPFQESPNRREFELDRETLDKWCREAKVLAAEASKKLRGRDLPPGFDADDKRHYTFRPD